MRDLQTIIPFLNLKFIFFLLSFNYKTKHSFNNLIPLDSLQPQCVGIFRIIYKVSWLGINRTRTRRVKGYRDNRAGFLEVIDFE